MVLWAMHPWERDARLAHHVLHQHHPAAIVVEVTCTRSAVELLGAFRVTAGGRTLQRYGVLEEAGRESAAAWSRRTAMVEQEAGIGGRERKQRRRSRTFRLTGDFL